MPGGLRAVEAVVRAGLDSMAAGVLLPRTG